MVRGERRRTADSEPRLESGTGANLASLEVEGGNSCKCDNLEIEGGYLCACKPRNRGWTLAYVTTSKSRVANHVNAASLERNVAASNVRRDQPSNVRRGNP